MPMLERRFSSRPGPNVGAGIYIDPTPASGRAPLCFWMIRVLVIDFSAMNPKSDRPNRYRQFLCKTPKGASNRSWQSPSFPFRPRFLLPPPTTTIHASHTPRLPPLRINLHHDIVAVLLPVPFSILAGALETRLTSAPTESRILNHTSQRPLPTLLGRASTPPTGIFS